MSFYIYDVTFLVLFSILVGFFLYKKRHNLKREGIMYLYRTQIGVKFINYIGEKYKRFLSIFAFIGIICGYLLMASMIYFLYKLIYLYLFVPEVVKAIKIPPLMPLIPYLPEAFKIDFLPPFYFAYWIIAIAVIAIFHEFAHGIIARRYGVKILTTGFGFLGPFLAAFVEPDEKQMVQKPKYQQIAILSAGVFTNLILAIIFFVLLSLFFMAAYIPAGAMFNTYTPGLININSIEDLGGKKVINASNENILKIIQENNLTDELALGKGDNEIKLTKMIADNKTYFITIEKLELQLKKGYNDIVVYEDLPAINQGLSGVIININNREIKTNDDLADELKKYKPGDKINLITKDISKNREGILEFNFILGEDHDQKGRAVLGIGLVGKDERVLGKIADFFNFFKKSATYYEPRFNIDLIVFIYNLIWWLALINLSVAMINMWPVGIFDGGRMFMLTIWAITGSERLGKLAFKIATYLILGSLAILMIGWFTAVF